MKKTKIRSITITALTLVLALVLSFAIGSLTHFRKAMADYRPSTIFSSGTGGTVGVSDDAESETKYVKFTFDGEGSVHFRRDLALKWFAPAEKDTETENGNETEGQDLEENSGKERKNSAACRYFNMEFSFVSVDFTEFSLTFESAEENFSKDSKSTNKIKIYNTNGTITATVQNASEQELAVEDLKKRAVNVDITNGVMISFDERDCEIGEFCAYLNGTFIGTLTNVGGYYMEYLSSSSTTPRIPMTFTADKLLEGKTDLKLLMKSLNGQSFKLNDSERIDDNADPVLVLNEQIYAYNLGKRWNLTYEAIDVCDETVTVTRKFAMLKKDENGAYKKPGKDDYKALTTSTYFMPTSDDSDLEQYVSIYFDLDDGSDISNLTDEEKEARYIYLTWYAVDGAVATLGEGEDEFDYIKVNREQGGPRYIGIRADSESKKNIKEEDENGVIIDQLAEEYQKAVDEASEGLSAGAGSYFYLPSLRGLIESDFADYRNLRFSIYFRKQSDEVGSSASSATSLRYNSLRFEIGEDGKYLFKVLASDSSSNVMKYFYEDKLQDVTASNIWEIDEIPSFTFEVSYTGATIEDPGTQSLGYCDQSYTFTAFEIVALEGYETNYTLYKFNRSDVPSNIVVPGYDTLAENTAEYIDRLLPYMTEIKEYNDEVTEEDEDRWNRTDNAYHWDPDTALSFTPQDPAYYILKLVVTEARLPGSEAVSYQVIDVRNKIDSLPDVSDWFENNRVSIILFSIAAFLGIVLVVMFVVRPSEQSVEEVDLESLKRKHKKDSNQNNSSK